MTDVQEITPVDVPDGSSAPIPYPLLDTAPPGYVRTMELAVLTPHIDRPRLCQVWQSPHLGEEPAKVWVPIPGQ